MMRMRIRPCVDSSDAMTLLTGMLRTNTTPKVVNNNVVKNCIPRLMHTHLFDQHMGEMCVMMRGICIMFLHTGWRWQPICARVLGCGREGKDRDQKIPSKGKKVSAKKITEGSSKPKKVVVKDEGKALKEDLKKEEKVSKKAAAEGKKQEKIKKEKEDALKKLNKRRKAAIKSIKKSKLGGSPVGDVLTLLFNADPSLVQEADLETFWSLCVATCCRTKCS